MIRLFSQIIVLHPHLLYPGGASKYALEVSERLAKKGMTVTVVTTQVNRGIIARYKHLKFVSLGGFPTGSFFYWLFYPYFQIRLQRLINSFGEDIILFPQIFPPVWWAGIYKLFNPHLPVVWMCQEPSAFVHSPLVIKSLKYPMRFFAEVFNPFLKIFDKRIVKKIDFIVANSNYSASLIKRVYGREASLVAYPSVDTEKYRPTKKKEKYIFTVSRLDKQKNIDLLIRGYKLLTSAIKRDYRLLIGGSGAEEKALKQLVDHLGLTEGVEFLGRIEEEKLPGFYSKATLTVFLGEDEPFGIVPIESMSCGTPVIALGKGGVLESVVNDKTGILLDNKDEKQLASAIEYLLTHPRKMKSMAENVRSHVINSFTWDKTADKIFNLLKNQRR